MVKSKMLSIQKTVIMIHGSGFLYDYKKGDYICYLVIAGVACVA